MMAMKPNHSSQIKNQMQKQMIVLIKLSNIAGEVNINIEDMKKSFASAIHLPRLKHLKDTVYADQIKYLQTKNPNEFSELKRVYENRMEQLNSHK
jgi:hypothetical protein